MVVTMIVVVTVVMAVVVVADVVHAGAAVSHFELLPFYAVSTSTVDVVDVLEQR